jgi:hypothetical protein
MLITDEVHNLWSSADKQRAFENRMLRRILET